MRNEFINSLTINSYPFTNESSEAYELNQFMKNSWPIVYIIKNDQTGEAYIGESTNAINRMKNHLSNRERRRLNEVLVISCDKFNKSAVLDIESQLISYMDADKQYTLQNGNAGLVDHNYYQRSQYRFIFEELWSKLLAKNYALNPIERLDNSDFFKFSPYKSLSPDQHQSVLDILTLLGREDENTIFVEGGAGTGKSVLAVYLLKLLSTDIQEYHLDETDEIYSEQLRKIMDLKKRYPNPKMALVVPMTSLRKTLKKVFKSVKGLTGSMVIGPTEVSRNKYDILLVDEAHRLRRRKALTGYGAFDKANRLLGLDKYEGTELDWVLTQSKNQIFFYDEGQSVKPSDVDKSRFKNLKKRNKKNVKLTSQMRVKGGQDYIGFVDDLLHCRLEVETDKFQSEHYDLKLFTDLEAMHLAIKEKEKKFGLCRMLAGFSWKWKSNPRRNDATPNVMDIEIDGYGVQWNKTTQNWINSENAVDQVGCIHTSQGYDLNFAGIIFGREIKYNPETKEIEVDPEQYHDTKGKQGIEDPKVLKEYIINIYKTMMLRGIKGTYVYACDPALREYLSSYIQKVEQPEEEEGAIVKRISHDELKPYENGIPLYSIQAAAGEFSEVQQVEDLDWISLPEDIRYSKDLFACRVIGDSMNKIIPNGSICLFRKYDGGTRNGRIVLAELTDIQDPDTGSAYTVKHYQSTKSPSADGRWEHDVIQLQPRSFDSRYESIILKDADVKLIQVRGVFIRVLREGVSN